MDPIPLLRTLGGLGIVLGLLAGALWAVRRFDIKLPGRIGGEQARRLAVIERLAIDPKRSVTLIRRDDQEHLMLICPEGAIMIETAITPHAALRRLEPHLPEAAKPASSPWHVHRFPAFPGEPRVRARAVTAADA